jgi:YgiT-type zinc finger domain-containing protein
MRKKPSKLLKRCPTCGSNKIHLVRGNFQTRFRGEKLVIPNLEREECPNCGEILFIPKAMRQLESQRKQLAVK